MVKYFDEEWPKEEELLRLGLEMSRKNKADRFFEFSLNLLSVATLGKFEKFLLVSKMFKIKIVTIIEKNIFIPFLFKIEVIENIKIKKINKKIDDLI